METEYLYSLLLLGNGDAACLVMDWLEFNIDQKSGNTPPDQFVNKWGLLWGKLDIFLEIMAKVFQSDIAFCLSSYCIPRFNSLKHNCN